MSGGSFQGASLLAPKVLAWLNDNYPREWVGVGGTNVSVCRGLEKRGQVEMRGRPGKLEVRLTPEGRGEA